MNRVDEGPTNLEISGLTVREARMMLAKIKGLHSSVGLCI